MKGEAMTQESRLLAWEQHGRALLAAHRGQLPSEAADLYGGGCGCNQCNLVLELLREHPAQPASETPSSRWKENGEPDPHGTRYDCERAALCMGDLTDDELANAVFLHGDTNPSFSDIASGKAVMPIAYLTAAKDRIRWLSRKLTECTAQPASAPDERGVCTDPDNCQRCKAVDWQGLQHAGIPAPSSAPDADEIEACLADDAALVREQYPEVAENMDKAADALAAFQEAKDAAETLVGKVMDDYSKQAERIAALEAWEVKARVLLVRWLDEGVDAPECATAQLLKETP